uniref:Uncharacterized protein n=1 Tax=Arundo donax TaxID=35708 RepID=A0A0A9H440_ARUDO
MNSQKQGFVLISLDDNIKTCRTQNLSMLLTPTKLYQYPRAVWAVQNWWRWGS